MFRDFKHAYRLLRKTPVATIVTALALALGIGANASSFVGVKAILLRPFPYPNLDRIMTIWESTPKNRSQREGVAPANLIDWTEKSGSFDQLAAYRPWSVNLTGGERPQQVEVARVTPSFFRVLEMKPEIGRTFTAHEGESGNDSVVVLSEGFWRTRLAAARNVIGTTISLGGQSHTVIGVMPDDFDYPLATDLWVPLSLTPAEKTGRDFHNLLVLGLLKPNVKVSQARAEMGTIAEALERRYPQTNAGRTVTITPLSQMTEQVTNRFVTVIWISALFLLLLAAANVANLQLARATDQQKAIAIETALGATRFRIARLLCAESILVALAGGGLGLWAASWMNDLNQSAIPAQVYHWVPGIRHLRVDSTVVLFTLVLSLLTGILCSLPAIFQLLGKHSTTTLAEALSQGSRNVAGDMRNRLRSALVIFEVAIALLLLVGAGVMVNTFQHMLSLNLGFNPANVLTAEISLPKADYSENAQIVGFFDRLLPDLTAVPSVRSASAEGNAGRASGFLIEGQPEPTAADPRPDVRVVDEHYFQTMELPMIRGRAIGNQDGPGSAEVIVVSKSIAEHYWPASDPTGHRIRFARSPWLTIVGVCGDRREWFNNQPIPAVYIPYRQASVVGLPMRLLLRTDGDPLRVVNAVVARIRAADQTEPVYNIKSMEQILFEQRSGVEASARIMAGNAVIALFLAITGIYGVISYFVSQRTKEIGIRIALGATTPDILKMTIGQACRVAGIGLIIGVPAAYLLMRVLSSVLYNVVVVKWTMFSSVTALLVLAALLAGYIPARRAAGIDPVVALRNE